LASFEEVSMRLNPLFEGELRYDESTEAGVAAFGATGDIASYAQGDGRITGDQLSGNLRWTNHPRRRADGVGLPDFHGVISTDDGADILFSFHGYSCGLKESAKPHPLQPYDQRAALAALTLAAGDDRYRWVNRIFAVIEADVHPLANPEHWRVKAFECVNEIVNERR
jgi:hypothetical protein